jgi:hypothetical protein
MRSRNEGRLTIKLFALILTIAMGLDGTGVAQEIISVPEDLPTQVLDGRALKAKAEVTRRGLGAMSKVRVKMRDKHQLTGRILLDDHSFQLRVEPAFLDDLEPAKGTVLRIPYSEVEKIRGARSRGADTVMGIGVVAAGLAILAAVLVLNWDRCRRSYCS